MYVKFLYLLAILFAAALPAASLTATTMAAAIRAGDEVAVAEHLRAGLGGDTLTGSNFGTTALMTAAVAGRSNIIALLAPGARQVDARESYGQLNETALMKSFIRGSEAGTLALLQYGADPQLTNGFGWNALHLAAYRGFMQALAKLLEMGLPIEDTTREGYTALLLAARNGHAGSVRLLLAKGAKITARTATGLSAIELARLAPWPETLIALGVAPEAGNREARLFLGAPRIQSAFRTQSTLEKGRPRVSLTHGSNSQGPAMVVEVEPGTGGRVVRWKVGERELLKALSPLDGDRAGGIPILFPTPNAVRDCRLAICGQTLLMRNPDQPRPTGMHGYAIDDVFSWAEPHVGSGEASLTVRLEHDVRAVRWAAFPLSNSLSVTYRLGPKSLRIEYEVLNRDRRVLPVGFGVHPYWAMTGETNLRLTATHSHLARFEGGRRQLGPTTGALDLRSGRTPAELPDGTTFIFGQGADAWISWLDLPRLKLKLTADPSLAYLVLHNPGGGAICVEHQGNAPDAHRLLAAGHISESGLFQLRPGETVRGWVEYVVETKP